jgi:outer membrane protein
MKKIIIALALALTSFTALQAQTLKIGYINADELVSLMPEYEKAAKTLQDFSKPFEDQIRKMETDRENKIKDVQSNAKMDQSIQEIKINEITALEQQIEEAKYKAQEKVNKKKEELLAPILKKADDAIKSVAKKNGYTYVLDAINSGILYAPESDDIRDMVLKEMGIAIPQATPAPKQAPQGGTPKPAPKPAGK